MKTIPIFLTGILAFGLCYAAMAQQKTVRTDANSSVKITRISGNLTDAGGIPIPDANILLLKATDSSLVKGMVSTSSGAFTFMDVPAGHYRVKTLFTGYQPVYTPVFTLSPGGDINVGTLKMSASSVNLNGLTVHAKKPLFEQKIDRLVINVKSSPMAASGTALDVLEKSPGVQVDRQEKSISVNGKDGVVLMINGKKQYMPMEAFFQMMASMKASNIEKIELITTPPAKYDAEGNAGYINIVMSNDPNMGFNGSYNLTMSYPYGEIPGAGFNFNYRSGKWSLFGNLSYTRTKEKQLWTNYRETGVAPEVTVTKTENHRDAVTPYADFRFGATYQIDSATSIGAMVNGFNSRWKMTSVNNTTVGTGSTVDTIITTKNQEINHWQNLMANLNMEHHFSSDQKLTVDLNYIYFRDNNPNQYLYSYYNPKNEFLFSNSAQSGKLTPIRFWVFSADYEGKIGKKLKLEAGAKSSITRFTNDLKVLNNKEIQPDMSARYYLNENTSALYGSLSMNLSKKTSLEGGLRFEYTTSNLGTQQTLNIVDRKYGELFPTLYFSHKFNERRTLNLSYSRRISRPSFDDLAPFAIFLDPTTFMTGNPALQPSISDAAEISYLIKSLVIRASYTHEAHTISGTNQVDIATNKQLITVDNLGTTHYVALSVSIPVTVTNWWNMQNTLSGNYQQVTADYNGSPIRDKGFNYSLNSIQDFTLPHGYSFELKGFYYSSQLSGIKKVSSYGMIGIGGSKKFKDNGTLSFAIRDLLGPVVFTLDNNMPEQHFDVRRSYKFWNRNLSLTYSRNFGDKALKVKRKWNTGSEEELNRVNH